MKTFLRHRSYNELKSLCKQQNVEFADAAYKDGSDYIMIYGGGAVVFVNMFNGRFFGKDQNGYEFNSDSMKDDNKEWFQKLLNFIYIT